MLRYALLVGVILSASIAVSEVFDTPTDDARPVPAAPVKLPQSALDAAAKRDGALKRAEMLYKEAQAAVRKGYLADLDAAIQTAMKAGKADEVAALAAVRKAAGEEVMGIGPSILGATWLHNGRSDGKVQCLSDGSLTVTYWGAKHGRWKTVDDHTIAIVQPDRMTGLITFASDGRHALWVNADGFTATMRRDK